MKSDDSRLSILHIAAPTVVGGLERVVQSLAIGHHRVGHRVGVATVIDMGEGNHPFFDPLLEANVNVFPIPLPRRAYLEERRLVAELCRRFQPDVVHTHGERPDVLDADVARRMGVPTATTLHGASQLGGIGYIYLWVQRRLLPKFDAVVAVSRPIADRLARDGVPIERIHVVPNSWAGEAVCLSRALARAALGLPLDRFIVGWVGRLIPAKGCDVFLQALAKLSDLPVTGTVIGYGSQRSSLEDHAHSLELNGRITFQGIIQNAARYFSAFDLFVLSSRTEGTPITLLEAISAGVPVVAAEVGGVPDVVTNAEAYLVPSENSAALAAAMRMAYSDPSGASERASRARRRLSTNFNLFTWLSRYEQIYRSIRH